MSCGLGIVATLLGVICGAGVDAQQPPASSARTTFEVASVTRNVSGRVGGAIQVPPAGAVTFTNVMLRVLIREAYQVDAYTEPYTLDPGKYVRLIGSSRSGPDQDIPRFDVQGRPPDNTPPRERLTAFAARRDDEPPDVAGDAVHRGSLVRLAE